MHNHNWSPTEWDSYSDAVYSRNVEDLISNFTEKGRSLLISLDHKIR